MFAERSALRVRLSPPILAWGLFQGLSRPFRRAKARREWVRRGRRSAPLGWPSLPIDAGTTAATLARPGPHLVFVGNGMGEFTMIRRVVEALREARPDAKVSVALRNNDALTEVRARHPGLNASYWPPDEVGDSIRWLLSQRPDVLVLTETYAYPSLVRCAAAFGTRVVLMNGRCGFRGSFRRPLGRLFYRWLFGGFAAIATQREAYAEAVRPLVAPGCDLRTSGDLKTDVRAPSLPEPQRASLEAWLASDPPLVAAGSTENLEEERMVLAAFVRTRADRPCRLLLAPRLPTVEAALLEAIREAGLTVSRRSEGGGPADVLLLDTQFELSTAYRACAAAYVGGAYTALGGGHNVMEPLLWRVPVAYGPRRGNFEAIQLLVEEGGVGTRIASADDLAAFWLRFLADPAERARVGDAGHRLLEASRGAVARTVAILEDAMDRAAATNPLNAKRL